MGISVWKLWVTAADLYHPEEAAYFCSLLWKTKYWESSSLQTNGNRFYSPFLYTTYIAKQAKILNKTNPELTGGIVKNNWVLKLNH